MRAEGHALLGDLAEFAQAEDLEASRVGKDGMRPGHEALQASEAADLVDAWAQVEVVRVAEEDLDAEVLEKVLGDSFHRGDGAYGHEDGGLDFAMRSRDLASAG